MKRAFRLGVVTAMPIIVCIVQGSACAAAGGGGAAPAAAAAPQSPVVLLQDKANNQSLFDFDYGIPTSPALTLIGTSTDKSSPSTSLKPYVITLPASWGGAKDSQSFGLDFAPEWLLRQDQVSYDEYNNSWLAQLEHRTRLESALFLGDDGGGDTTKQKASRLAFGASISLLRDSDPLAVRIPGTTTSVWQDCVAHVFETSAFTGFQAKVRQLRLVPDRITGYRGEVQKTAIAFGDIGAPLLPGRAALLAATEQHLSDCLKKDGICAGLGGSDKLQNALSIPDGTDAQTLSKLQSLDAALSNMYDYAEKDFEQKQGGDISAAFDTCVSKANAAARVGADLDVGGGVTWSGKPGSASGFTDASGVLWAAGKVPLGLLGSGTIAGNAGTDPDASAVMLGGSLRASWAEQIATGNAAMPSGKANALDAWMGLEFYKPDFRLAAEGGYTRTVFNAPALSSLSRSGLRWQLAASLRLDSLLGGVLTGILPADSTKPANGAWLNASYGSSSGTVTALDDKAFLVSLSFSPGNTVFPEGSSSN